MVLLSVTTIGVDGPKNHVFSVSASGVARTHGHVIVVTDSYIANTDMGGQITEFFKLTDPDGYHLMCEWLSYTFKSI